MGHTKLDEFENRFLCEQMDRTDSDMAINIYKPYKNESERICVYRAHLLIRRENFQIARGSGEKTRWRTTVFESFIIKVHFHLKPRLNGAK